MIKKESILPDIAITKIIMDIIKIIHMAIQRNIEKKREEQIKNTIQRIMTNNIQIIKINNIRIHIMSS